MPKPSEDLSALLRVLNRAFNRSHSETNQPPVAFIMTRPMSELFTRLITDDVLPHPAIDEVSSISGVPVEERPGGAPLKMRLITGDTLVILNDLKDTSE